MSVPLSWAVAFGVAPIPTASAKATIQQRFKTRFAIATVLREVARQPRRNIAQRPEAQQSPPRYCAQVQIFVAEWHKVAANSGIVKVLLLTDTSTVASPACGSQTVRGRFKILIPGVATGLADARRGCGRNRISEARSSGSRTGSRERHRDPIHTIAKASWFRPILEHMAEMSTAAMAMHLRPRHPKCLVDPCTDRMGEGLPKARPAGVTVEFCLGREQRQVTTGASKGSLPLFMIQGTRIGALGAFLSQHVVLLGGQQRPPFRVRMSDLESLGRGRRRSRPQDSIDEQEAGCGNAAEENVSSPKHGRPSKRCGLRL
jgi:hypothetical protein